MSHSLYRWAWKQELNDKPRVKASAQKFVLLCIADHANGSGDAWPGNDKIAKETHLSGRTVARAIEALIEDGFICRRRRFQTSNIYTFPISDTMADIEPISDTMAGPYVTPCHPISDTMAGEPSINQVLNTTEEENARLPPCPTTPKAAYSHPLFKLYLDITDTLPSNTDYQYVYDHMQVIYDQEQGDPESIRARLRPAWLEWKKRNYNPMNPHFLEWAMNGIIPTQKIRKSKGKSNIERNLETIMGVTLDGDN